MEKQVKEKQCEHSKKILELQNHLKAIQYEVLKTLFCAINLIIIFFILFKSSFINLESSYWK